MPLIFKKEKREVEEKVYVGFICDKCKREFHHQKDWIEWQERFQYSFIGGYGSVFGDQSEFEIVLCQHCLEELLGEYLREVTTDEDFIF